SLRRAFCSSCASFRFFPPVPHPCQAPMTVTTCLQQLWIDSTSVVANPHVQIAVGILKFELNALSSGVAETIHRSLRRPVHDSDFVATSRSERDCPLSASFTASLTRLRQSSGLAGAERQLTTGDIADP